MSGTYYAVVEGDPLTSGRNSQVRARSNLCWIEDKTGKSRRMVFIGDDAYCEKCESVGVIAGGAGVSDMHRMADMENSGRRQAVGGDFVLCKCADHPRIIAVHGRNWIIHDQGEAGRAERPLLSRPS